MVHVNGRDQMITMQKQEQSYFYYVNGLRIREYKMRNRSTMSIQELYVYCLQTRLVLHPIKPSSLTCDISATSANVSVLLLRW